MSIASTSFLFLFMPLSLGIYHLIPTRFRNHFLLCISLFFYAWGEPVFILLLLLLILSVWMAGKMAEDRKGTAMGRWAVALTVILNVGMLLSFKYLSHLLDLFGLLISTDLSFLMTTLPIGMSFFCFHAVSYVVDIYRGQCHTPKSILSTALYLSVFFKMLQGPIITYREFEPQIEARVSTWEDVREGIWRFAIGFGKKMIIASNLAPMLKIIFATDYSTLTMADAWIGCVTFMVFLYFDFSGYSDMAIGLGRMFGFRMPENFNYPYISTSIAEYWRRWHMTLIAWFRDYLYYPILLGPSVRFRKYLLRHNVGTQVAKILQNIFVPTCVWIVTALWHGTNWNYTIWGLANAAVMVIEPYIKPLRNKPLDATIRWFCVMMILMMMVPLICTDNLTEASLYMRAMFAGTDTYGISALTYCLSGKAAIFLLTGIVFCFPVVSFFKRRIRNAVVWNVAATVSQMMILVLALSYLFRSSMVWFMYQQ